MLYNLTRSEFKSSLHCTNQVFDYNASLIKTELLLTSTQKNASIQHLKQKPKPFESKRRNPKR